MTACTCETHFSDFPIVVLFVVLMTGILPRLAQARDAPPPRGTLSLVQADTIRMVN
jgi:hypothetical protein